MRSCWSGEDDQLVGGLDVTVVVRWVPGSTLGCGTRMARPVRNGWGPGAKWRRSDPQHVLRCSQGLPIGTTSLRWGARRRSSSRVASRNPSWPGRHSRFYAGSQESGRLPLEGADVVAEDRVAGVDGHAELARVGAEAEGVVRAADRAVVVQVEPGGDARVGWTGRRTGSARRWAGPRCGRPKGSCATRRGARRRPRPPRRPRQAYGCRRYPVPAGTRAHDVAPAADGRSAAPKVHCCPGTMSGRA
jgi:hypothetical protein